MSNYSDPITATGSLISVQNRSGGLVDSLSVPITPDQDLHGYSKPWAAGGGVNLFDVDSADYFTGLGGNAKKFGHSFTVAGTYALKLFQNGGSGLVRYFIQKSDNSWVGPTTITTTGKTVSVESGDTLYVIDNAYTGAETETGRAHAITLFNNWKVSVALSASQPGQYYPYSNICPISGLTGLSVYVSPTQNVADATTYAVDWTADAGTVYAGSIDIVSGALKARPQYASYNGETLTGPWLSSLDEYAAGTTPTTGAQVVDLGGTETACQLTAQDVALLIGQNYLWASTSEVLTMIYRLWLKYRETGATSIGKNAESLTVTPQFNGVSKVVINITPELAYEAGNDTGRTITIDCPWGTQAMANNLLTMLEGFQYQPYEAENALLDPSAELGDGLTVNGVYGGIFKMTVRSGVLHAVDVSSPQDEEIDHEYPFVASSERKIERQLANVKSELSVQADQISAKVDREGGDPSSVSWEMNADQFKILSDGSEVLIIDDNGLTVNGDGNFTGDVHAGNIKYGGSSGHFSGSGIKSKSIGTGQTNDGINTSLGNADYSAGVFSGANEAKFVKATNLYCSGEFKYNGTVFAPATYYVLDGSDNKVKVRLFKQKDNPS